MALSNKLKLFFVSECKSIKEVDVLVEETSLQQEWIDAVMSYRNGMLLLQKNDLSGLEYIKTANNVLKQVVAKSKKPNIENVSSSLSESIEKFNKDTIDSSVQLIKEEFSDVYVKMKENGFKPYENESNFYKEDSEIIKENDDTEMSETDDADLDDLVADDTDVITEPDQAEKIEEKKEMCAYEEGFHAGRKYWKKDGKMTEALKTVVEQNLSEKPYKWVQSYQEGFSMGHKFEQRVQEEVCPDCFKVSDTTDTSQA